jgi:peroxiredoxin
MNDEERAYNLEEFIAAAPAPINPGGTMAGKVGVAAPDFEAEDLNGAVVRLADFRGKRHVVMMTGAVTSPMCAFEVPEFNRLHAEFDSRSVSFVLLYTRESHPAENYSAHQSFEQKVAYARELRRLEDVRFPILVDHLDGRIHRAYGVWPNALFVIHKDGRLIFRSNMANHRELREFLNDLLEAEHARTNGKVTHLQYSERVVPHEADQATHRRV